MKRSVAAQDTSPFRPVARPEPPRFYVRVADVILYVGTEVGANVAYVCALDQFPDDAVTIERNR